MTATPEFSHIIRLDAIGRLQWPVHVGADEAQRAAPASGDARPWRWLTATAFTAVLAVGVGLQFLPQAPTPSSPGVTTPAPLASTDGETLDETAAGTLEEDPDLYLWLASAEAQPLAME